MKQILFLDIDGVLNDNRDIRGGLAGLQRDKIEHLNTILEAVPDCKIILSSAWRSFILTGEMTCYGFEWMLVTHGYRHRCRLIDVTCADRVTEGRESQILQMVDSHKPDQWCALDDDTLDLPFFVKTNGTVGLTAEDAQKVIGILNGATNEP